MQILQYITINFESFKINPFKIKLNKFLEEQKILISDGNYEDSTTYVGRSVNVNVLDFEFDFDFDLDLDFFAILLFNYTLYNLHIQFILL